MKRKLYKMMVWVLVLSISLSMYAWAGPLAPVAHAMAEEPSTPADPAEAQCDVGTLVAPAEPVLPEEPVLPVAPVLPVEPILPAESVTPTTSIPDMLVMPVIMPDDPIAGDHAAALLKGMEPAPDGAPVWDEGTKSYVEMDIFTGQTTHCTVHAAGTPAPTYTIENACAFTFDGNMAPGVAWLSIDANTGSITMSPPHDSLYYYAAFNVVASNELGRVESEFYVFLTFPLVVTPEKSALSVEPGEKGQVRIAVSDFSPSYEVTLKDGSALPDWISFLPETYSCYIKVEAPITIPYGETYIVCIRVYNERYSETIEIPVSIKPRLQIAAESTAVTVRRGEVRTVQITATGDPAPWLYSDRNWNLPDWIVFYPESGLLSIMPTTTQRSTEWTVKIWAANGEAVDVFIEIEVEVGSQLEVPPVELIVELGEETAIPYSELIQTPTASRGALAKTMGVSSYRCSLMGMVVPWITAHDKDQLIVIKPPNQLLPMTIGYAWFMDGTDGSGNQVSYSGSLTIIVKASVSITNTQRELFLVAGTPSKLKITARASILGKKLSCALAGGEALPPWITVDGEHISFSPAAGQIGDHSLKVTLSNWFAKDTAIFTIHVLPVTPTIALPKALVVVQQTKTRRITVQAQGVPQPTTTIVMTSAPPGATESKIPNWIKWDAVNGILTARPGANQAVGDYVFEIMATNGYAPDATATLTVRVAPYIPGADNGPLVLLLKPTAGLSWITGVTRPWADVEATHNGMRMQARADEFGFFVLHTGRAMKALDIIVIHAAGEHLRLTIPAREEHTPPVEEVVRLWAQPSAALLIREQDGGPVVRPLTQLGESEAQEFPLLVGGILPVGTVHVERKNGQLRVRYELDVALEGVQEAHRFTLYPALPHEHMEESRDPLPLNEWIAVPDGAAQWMLLDLELTLNLSAVQAIAPIDLQALYRTQQLAGWSEDWT